MILKKALFLQMVYSELKNETRRTTRIKSTNELTPKRSLKYKCTDEMLSEDIDLHDCSSKNTSSKLVIIKLHTKY